ncbi:MAG: hypothetical protein ACP5JU_00825 [Minisyncoccia bacterium]
MGIQDRDYYKEKLNEIEKIKDRKNIIIFIIVVILILGLILSLI